jgi:ABC-type transport system substrate-binding protein
MQVFKPSPATAPGHVPRALAAAVGIGLSLAVSGLALAKDYPTVTVVDSSPVNWLWITWNTMEEAVRVDYNGRTQPALAEEWEWQDKQTLELDMRDNVVFQDGSVFDPAVFKRSFDEVQKWENPHPPGPWLNYAAEANMKIPDEDTTVFHTAVVDGATITKLRGMHVGSEQFWNQGGFNTAAGTSEGNW